MKELLSKFSCMCEGSLFLFSWFINIAVVHTHYLLTFACFKAGAKLSVFKRQEDITCSRTVTFAFYLPNLMVEPGYAKCQSFGFCSILASSSKLFLYSSLPSL